MKLTEAKTVSELSPKTRKTLLWFVLGSFLLLFIVCLIPSDEDRENAAQKAELAECYIKGFDPTITNLALKQYGFQTDTDFSSDGNLWTAERDDIFIKYSVVMYSPDDADQITSYRLTIMVEPGYEKISKGKWMMKELSGVKYDGNDAAKAYEWVENNYNKDKSFIDIGGVRFTISAPSDYVRILNINKINPETGDIFN